ncbi:MAG: peptidoglycan-binding protein [Micrococcus sp.]|nr:peptidoglycan-binding protein [Micrococcus sp.]
MTDHITAPHDHAPHPSSTRPSSPDATAPGHTLSSRLSRRGLLKGTVALGGALTFSAAVANLAIRQAHAATVGRPAIISTAAWQAQPVDALPLITRAPGYLVIHHTTHQNSSDFSLDGAHALARLLQRNHLRNGWADTGQQFTIGRGGHILEGRHGSLAALDAGDRFVQGAHAYGFNDHSVGIEVDGLYMTAVPTQGQWRALVHLCAYACLQYGIAVEDIIAHRDVPGAQTHCCGDAFYARLPALRHDVAAALGRGTSGTDAAGTYPTLREGDRGQAVRRLQTALHDAGHAAGAADGIFGAQTAQAVRGFQAAIGTMVDGQAGPLTWSALVTRPAQGVTLRRGASGSEVTYLQRGLTAALQEGLVADGQFGPATDTAVRSYQSSRGLVVDGIVGNGTWYDLKHGR